MIETFWLKMWLCLLTLWITFRKGNCKDLQWMPIHSIVRSLGPRSKEVPLFHAFTGLDTVSVFAWKGIKTAWQA